MWTVRILGAVCVVGTLLPLLPTGFWAIRGWDFPRFQLAVALFALTVLTVIFRHRFGFAQEFQVWLSLLSLACLWQASHVVQFTPFWGKEVRTTESGAGRFRVAVSNLDYENTSQAAAAEQLGNIDADVLILIEIDRPWSERLQSVRDQFRYRHEEIQGEGLGLAIWSKLPMVSAETRFLVEARRPSIWARIEFEGSFVNLIGVHPTPPGLRDSTGDNRRDSRVRDAELIMIAKQVAQRNDEAWIVAGDFNDVAWSHTTRLFKRLSGLKDPRIGRSFMGTYHADCPVIRFPIDHVFVSDGFSIAELQRYRIAGSDHFAMFASLAIAQPSAGVEPQPEGDDKLEARELVKEGIDDAQQRNILSQEPK